MAHPEPTEATSTAVPPPREELLVGLGSDAWAQVLVVIRAALRDLDEQELTPELRRLQAAPTSRLVAGRLRARLARLVAADGPLWWRLRQRLERAEALSDDLRWLLERDVPPPPPARATSVKGGAGAERPAPPPAASGGRDRLKERTQQLREQRDLAQRKLTGAESRADALEAKLGQVTEELAEERARARALEAQVAAATQGRDTAVDRERRRQEATIASLRTELRDLRRVHQEQVVAARRQQDAAQAAQPRPSASRSARDQRVQPGRPTVLPAGVRTPTTEAADLLLARGRLVLVDGYNVTKQHRPQLALAEQREWLVRLLAGFAARRGARLEVVFDGQAAAGGRSSGRVRGVVVRFSAAGTTADDDLHFAVAALPPDAPVVVVTDDRGLRDRLAPYRVDLLGTRPFLSVAS